MRIEIISPVANGSTRGNGVTARRWGQMLKSLGHSVGLSNSMDNSVQLSTDCVIGIHATRSAAILQRFRSRSPNSFLIVCVSGTDLNRDLAGPKSSQPYRRAAQSLTIADQVVVLEPQGIKALRDKRLKQIVESKLNLIFQSAVPVSNPPLPIQNAFEISVIGHLRKIKDPFRSALAAELLPTESKILISHLGKALTDEMSEQAIEHDSTNSRYRWLGNRTHKETMRRLARSRVTVLSSKSEGAPSLISEAVVNGVPILTSKIASTIGLLGANYPGFFRYEDTQGLCRLMQKCETDPQFLRQLKRHLRSIKKRFDPKVEQNAWKKLIAKR